MEQAVYALHLQHAGQVLRAGSEERKFRRPEHHSIAEFIGRRHVHEFAALHHDQVVSQPLDFLHLVRAVDDGAAGVLDRGQHGFEEGTFGHDIQAQRRFIKDQQLRRLRHGDRKVHAGTLATRQFAHALLGGNVEVVHDGAVARLVPLRIQPPLHVDYLVDPQPGRQAVFFVHEADPSAVVLGERIAVAIKDARAAAARRLEAEQDPEQGGLAGTVGADHGVDAALRNAQGQVFQRVLLAVAQRQRLGFNDIAGFSRRADRRPRDDVEFGCGHDAYLCLVQAERLASIGSSSASSRSMISPVE